MTHFDILISDDDRKLYIRALALLKIAQAANAELVEEIEMHIDMLECAQTGILNDFNS